MQTTPKADLLYEFLRHHLMELEQSSGSGGVVEYPGFQISPRDYLRFAEAELGHQDVERRINCVAHLKRAIDCEMDTFLYTFNLLTLTRERGLGFETKLNFLRDVALFSSRSLARFNNIRNRVEHEYRVPEIDDLEVFFDLAQAFVAVLESAILIFVNHAEEHYFIEPESEGAAEQLVQGVGMAEIYLYSRCSGF
jgi:hypothetical protein